MNLLLARFNRFVLVIFTYIFILPSFLMATSFQLENFNSANQTVDVMYDFSDGEVAGFQFNVTGVNLTGVKTGSMLIYNAEANAGQGEFFVDSDLSSVYVEVNGGTF